MGAPFKSKSTLIHSRFFMAKRRSKSDIVRTEMMGDHEVPFYRIKTTDGIVAEVPKYIKRIFSKRNGKINTAGWQIAYIRVDREPYNPFFSDLNNGPYQSLEKAIDDLRRFLARTPNTRLSGLRIEETKQDINRTGISGVRLDWRFGRRSALYELKIEVRAGAYDPERAKSFYVGTEFSITQERLDAAMEKARLFRNEQIVIASEKGQIFPKRTEQPNYVMTVDRAMQALKHHKERHIDYLDKIALEKAERWMSEKQLKMQFRNQKFTATPVTVKNETIKIPEFMWFEGDELQFEFALPDGTSYPDFTPITSNPKSDVTRAIADCFLESMLANAF